MEHKILFYEKQKFTQIWLWILLIGLFLLPIVSIFFDHSKAYKIHNSLFIYFGIMITIIVLLASCTLETWIDEKEVTIKFFPFHRKQKKFLIAEMEQMEVVQYNPIFDYGGWGIRFGGLNTMAYNTRGSIGLLLTFKDKKKVLIGTQQKVVLEKILAKIPNNHS